MPLTGSERERLIQQYADGPARLDGALAAVPAAARQWRPAPGEWSAHEVACHCADSEVNGAARIRYVVCEPQPLVLAYDESVWATTLDYHGHPLEPALAAVRAVRGPHHCSPSPPAGARVEPRGSPHRVGPVHRGGLARHLRRAPGDPRAADRGQRGRVAGGGPP
jgi:hypothetical protein